jgi:hypothetical protein
LSAAASIWALSIAFIVAPEALAFWIILSTYAATCLQVDVAARSWNGANWRSQVVTLQTAIPLTMVDLPPVISAWPFLLLQKPIVPSPIHGGPQTLTVTDEVCPVWVIFAVLVNGAQPFLGRV